jgi:putative FmdB family regulatory protein
MPVYEYKCNGCDARFEELVRSMSARQQVKCPQCGSSRTARTLSVFAVSSESAKSSPAPGGGCGRCGGPGPCAMDGMD